MSLENYSISPRFNELLQALYHGPVEQQPWQQFLMLLGLAVGGKYATLILRTPRPGDSGMVINAEIASEEVYNLYNEIYFAFDPFVDLPPGKVMTVDEFMPIDEYHASDYYKQYVKASGIGHIIGADICDELGNSARLRISRADDVDNFGNAERQLCQMLLPHLQQAIRLHARIARIESEKQLYAGAVDQFSMGTIILDESAQIRSSNQAAQGMLAEGNLFKLEGSELKVGSRSQHRQFAAVLKEVMEAHLQSDPSLVKVFRLDQRDGTAGVGILLRPLPLVDASDGSRNPAVAIFISNPAQSRGAQRDVLMELFGFTPSEANLALQLANGLTLDEASEVLSISRNTAKSHLSAIFSKTGVTRQTKLIQLILKSVALMGE